MNKKITSYLLILLITTFMAAPTLSILSDSIDSSMFYSLNEEDTMSHTNLKVFKVHSTESSSYLTSFDSESKNLNTSYLSLYTPYVKECISPPPELV